ncbi:hypothetical protein VTI74DRAFT_8728 [Chaetomium olivicolor]
MGQDDRQRVVPCVSPRLCLLFVEVQAGPSTLLSTSKRVDRKDGRTLPHSQLRPGSLVLLCLPVSVRLCAFWTASCDKVHEVSLNRVSSWLYKPRHRLLFLDKDGELVRAARRSSKAGRHSPLTPDFHSVTLPPRHSTTVVLESMLSGFRKFVLPRPRVSHGSLSGNLQPANCLLKSRLLVSSQLKPRASRFGVLLKRLIELYHLT